VQVANLLWEEMEW